MLKKYLNIEEINKNYDTLVNKLKNKTNDAEEFKKTHLLQINKLLTYEPIDVISGIKLDEKFKKELKNIIFEVKQKHMSIIVDTYYKENEEIKNGNHDYILNKADPSICMYYNNMLVLIANYNNVSDAQQKEDSIKYIKGYSNALRSDKLLINKIDIKAKLSDAINQIKNVNKIEIDDVKGNEMIKTIFDEEAVTGPMAAMWGKKKMGLEEALIKLSEILYPKGQDKIPFSPIMLPLKTGSS